MKRLLKRSRKCNRCLPQSNRSICKTPDGKPRLLEYKNQSHSAIQLSSLILVLKNIAEQRLGQSVTQAVITVPAYFGDVNGGPNYPSGRAC